MAPCGFELLVAGILGPVNQSCLKDNPRSTPSSMYTNAQQIVSDSRLISFRRVPSCVGQVSANANWTQDDQHERQNQYRRKLGKVLNCSAQGSGN
jgi:hypothetical protein